MSNRTSLDSPTRSPLRIVFLGRRCLLSAVPLRAIVSAGHHVAAVLLPGRRVPGLTPPPISSIRLPRRQLPLLTPSTPPAIEAVAAEAAIPLLEVARLGHPATLGVVASLQPDVLVVSCFPWRLPAALLALAPLGGVNVHPSLLPAYRGPDPLFWIYRHGCRETGVTVHRVSGDLDAGDILAQERIDVSLGLPGDELEARCAALGARLLVETLSALVSGAPEARPQDECRSSYFSWPDEPDLQIPPEWPAERAWHFARGVVPLGYEPTVVDGERRYVIRQALEVVSDANQRGLVEARGDVLSLRCRPGLLRAIGAPAGER